MVCKWLKAAKISQMEMWIYGGAEGNPSIKGAAQRLEQDLTSCKKLDKQLHNSNLDCSLLACRKHYVVNV